MDRAPRPAEPRVPPVRRRSAGRRAPGRREPCPGPAGTGRGSGLLPGRGGGFGLASSGDFIVASEAAVFWCPEVNSGMVPVAGAVQRLTGAAGHHHAARITMLGQPFTVAEAVALPGDRPRDRRVGSRPSRAC
ncbi:enoyl-CoA hydratase/isomerase family protein [Streptomyces sp. NPDC059627]